MQLNHVRRGTGKPLLLLHDLGGSWKSWSTVQKTLAAEREVIALDLPGFGLSKPLQGDQSVRALAQAVASFMEQQGITGCDAAGTGLGATILLELASRGGVVGSVVAMNPAGFWRGWRKTVFHRGMQAAGFAARMVRGIMPFLSRHAISKTLLYAHLSPHPWRLSEETVLDDTRDRAAAASFDAVLREMVHGEPIHGAPPHTLKHPIVLGWGRRDRLRFAGEAERAKIFFPDARVHWFEQAGHHPQWDTPQEVVRLVLGTSRRHALLPVAGLEPY